MSRLLWALPLCLLLGCSTAAEHPPTPPEPAEVPFVESTAGEKPLDAAGMEELARADAMAFLQQALRRYDREVRGYRALLIKQERVQGKLGPVEHVEVSFLESPFSVRMDWKKGFGLAARTAFVKGENNNQMLVKPYGWRGALVGVITRDPEDDNAKKSSRYPITTFGLKIGMQNTLKAWKAAHDRGDLKVLFNGTTTLPELGDRPCWELKRVGYPVPEKDGITEETFYFDKQNWLQVGSYLTGEGGKLIGSYYFRDLELNPTFAADTFTREGLRKKEP